MKAEQTNVLFITGAFVSHTTWNEWVNYFNELGYNAIAPAWPEKDAPASVLRQKQPNDINLANLTLQEVIDHYADIAISFDNKPIIIGHSLGGLITQILVNRGFAKAGAVIHSVPPQGVIPYEFTFLRSTWKVLGLFSSMKKTYLMSFKEFQYSFVNGLPFEEQQKAYESYAIPESKRVARGGLTSTAAVDFSKKHVPLLITAGSKDNVIPSHLSYRNYKKYKDNGSVLEYKEFGSSTHSILTQNDWKSEAGFISTWLEKHLKGTKSFFPGLHPEI